MGIMCQLEYFLTADPLLLLTTKFRVIKKMVMPFFSIKIKLQYPCKINDQVFHFYTNVNDKCVTVVWNLFLLLRISIRFNN